MGPVEQTAIPVCRCGVDPHRLAPIRTWQTAEQVRLDCGRCGRRLGVYSRRRWERAGRP